MSPRASTSEPLDYVETLAALQGFVGRTVRVSSAMRENGAIVTQFGGTLRGAGDIHEGSAVERHGESEQMQFIVTNAGGAACFCVWRDSFREAMRSEHVDDDRTDVMVRIELGDGVRLLVRALPD